MDSKNFHCDLKQEMQRDGQRMRQWLHAHDALRAWVINSVLPIANGPWVQIEGTWENLFGRYLSAALYLGPDHLLPTLQLDCGSVDLYGKPRLVGTLKAQWSGARLIDAVVTLHGEQPDLATAVR